RDWSSDVCSSDLQRSIFQLKSYSDSDSGSELQIKNIEIISPKLISLLKYYFILLFSIYIFNIMPFSLNYITDFSQVLINEIKLTISTIFDRIPFIRPFMNIRHDFFQVFTLRSQFI